MPKLPTALDLGATPSLAGDRPIPSVDTTAIGEGMARLGAAAAKMGQEIKAGWDAQQDHNAYSAFLAFKTQETLGYNDAADNLKPEQAQGFAKSYSAGFGQRGKAFLESLPENLRQKYDDELGVFGMGIIQGAQGIEKGEQTRQAAAKFDATIDKSIMPRVRMAAMLPDNDPNKEAQLAQLEREGAALIDTNSTLSPIEREKAKALLRAKIHYGFATSLDAEAATKIDPAYRLPPPVDDNGKPILGAKAAGVAWNQRLDGLTYDQKVAVAHDGYAAYVAQKTKEDAERQKQQKALHNAWENAVQDGTWGQADLNAAVSSGQLTDADERAKLAGMIAKRDAEGLNLAAVTTKMRPDSGYKFNPFNPDDQKSIDLWYDKGIAGGGKDLLAPPPPPGAAPAGGGQALDPASLLAAIVARTHYIPKSAVEQVKFGIYSSDHDEAIRTFTLMDGLSRADPDAYRRAFDVDNRHRLDIYQGSSGRVPDDMLWQELAPRDEASQKAHDAMEERGREMAAKIPDADIIGGVGGSFGWLGLGYTQPNAPDPVMTEQLRRDFNNNYAVALASGQTPEKSKDLALKWLKEDKWGKTDIGSGDAILMAYPPERYGNKIDGNYHWMDEQLEASVKAAHPDATAWGVRPTLATGGQALAGRSPDYQVWYVGRDGFFRVASDDNGKPLVMKFNYEKALGVRDANFAAKNAQQLDTNRILDQGEIFNPSGVPRSPASAPTLPGTSTAPAPTLPGKPAGENLLVPQRSKPAISGKPQASIDGERQVLARETLPNAINVPVSRKTNPIGEQKVAKLATAAANVETIRAARDVATPAVAAALRKANLNWDKYARHFRGFFGVGPETPLTSDMVAAAQAKAATQKADSELGAKGFNLFLDAILAIDSAMGKPR